VSVTATLLASNAGEDCFGVTDDGYNIDDDGSCSFTLPSISDYQTLSRTLGTLANNGGPTQTIALLPANPAIDYVPAADCPATDQRGDPRTAPCDIGAYDTDTPASQTITFTSTPPTNATVGGPTYTVSATGGGSGNPVMFTVDSSSTSICSISGAVVSFIGGGTCTIDANQEGNSTYSAAPQAQQSFPVGGPPPTITSFTPTSGAPGTKVTIKGTNLSGATSVTFNGTTATIINDTATKLKVKVPTGATTGKITLTTSDGSVTSTTKFKVT
jgi:hypothetical protein